MPRVTQTRDTYCHVHHIQYINISYFFHVNGALSFSLCFCLSLSWVTITVMPSTTEPTATMMEATAAIPLSRLRRYSTRLQHCLQHFSSFIHLMCPIWVPNFTTSPGLTKFRDEKSLTSMRCYMLTLTV